MSPQLRGLPLSGVATATAVPSNAATPQHAVSPQLRMHGLPFSGVATTTAAGAIPSTAATPQCTVSPPLYRLPFSGIVTTTSALSGLPSTSPVVASLPSSNQMTVAPRPIVMVTSAGGTPIGTLPSMAFLPGVPLYTSGASLLASGASNLSSGVSSFSTGVPSLPPVAPSYSFGSLPLPPGVSLPSPTLPSMSQLHAVGAIAPKIKLPKLSIKWYNGDLTKWVAFWDAFHSSISIHTNPSLSNVDKFNYLVSLLESSAAEAIACLSITSVNYDETISTLRKRFGNSQLIVNRHMEALLGVGSVSSHHDTKDNESLQMSALVVPFICNPLTSQPINCSEENYEHLLGLDLADSANIADSLEVDMLIGSDSYWSLVKPQ